MRISDWSSDVCSSDLRTGLERQPWPGQHGTDPVFRIRSLDRKTHRVACATRRRTRRLPRAGAQARQARPPADQGPRRHRRDVGARSEEHTSELQSLMRISYAVFCLKKKKHRKTTKHTTI